ncbi:tRNA preQ1(34) S-adenosylmethionine ribosyltransferase-isomerase QueA [Patescibacteria group bacterium]|nr:tRNA preQ1(34) S-adenosylmethionine ribosyltransferase-isomerase QueA [Patescibacteria group bacterium]
MSVKLFDYHLPPELIAQASVEPRDQSRLLVLEKQSGKREHKLFFEIIDELKAGDVLVMNMTKVFKARLRGHVGEKEVEVFLLREIKREKVGRVKGSEWKVLLKPGRLVSVGSKIQIGEMKAEVLEKTDTVRIKIDADLDQVLAYADQHGEIPVPPYVKQVPDQLEKYQTVYAEQIGSVAAPTAGFHFTKELLSKIREKGVQIEFVTLHVGIGTFRPMKTETIEEHEMHAEFVRVDGEVARRINQAKEEGRRIIAVGTTSVRTLEGVADDEGRLREFAGDVNLFIKPGYEFKIVDALITNFHLPKSTLLVLVSALAGRENIMAAYEEAVAKKYRFYSFGDAMLIK